MTYGWLLSFVSCMTSPPCVRIFNETQAWIEEYKNAWLGLSDKRAIHFLKWLKLYLFIGIYSATKSQSH